VNRIERNSKISTVLKFAIFN